MWLSGSDIRVLLVTGGAVCVFFVSDELKEEASFAVNNEGFRGIIGSVPIQCLMFFLLVIWPSLLRYGSFEVMSSP